MRNYEWVRPKAVPVISTLLAVIIMFSLGAWQLHRLAWKQDIIAKLEAGKHAEAVMIETIPANELEAHEFAPVMLDGVFDTNKPIFFAARYFRGETGYHVLLPFKLRNADKTVLVNTGWVPQSLKAKWAPQSLPASKIVFKGMIRVANRKNPYTPDNSAEKNVWFWYDMPALEKAVGTALLPVIIDRIDPQAMSHLPEVHYPVGFEANVKLRNDHLQYAVTWFGIGLAAIVIFMVAHTRKKTA